MIKLSRKVFKKVFGSHVELLVINSNKILNSKKSDTVQSINESRTFLSQGNDLKFGLV